MKHFYSNIEGWFDYHDFYRSVVLTQLPPNPSIVEVGCYKGRATAFLLVELLNAFPEFSLTCVDAWDSCPELVDFPVPLAEFLENLSPVSGTFKTIEALSVEGAKQVADQSLDFCFIDAAHDYDNVRADLDAWLPKMKPDSIIAGHDFIEHFDGLRRAVLEKFPSGVRIVGTAWFVVLRDGSPVLF